MKERKIRVKHEVLQDLQRLKIKLDMRSVSKVVKMLLDEYKLKNGQ